MLRASSKRPPHLQRVVKEEIFQNLSFKIGKTLQWVVGEPHQAIHPMGLTAQVFLVSGDGR